MADINHAITFGIGTPGDVPHFLLFGLSPTGLVLASIGTLIISVRADDLVVVVR